MTWRSFDFGLARETKLKRVGINCFCWLGDREKGGGRGEGRGKEGGRKGEEGGR